MAKQRFRIGEQQQMERGEAVRGTLESASVRMGDRVYRLDGRARLVDDEGRILGTIHHLTIDTNSLPFYKDQGGGVQLESLLPNERSSGEQFGTPPSPEMQLGLEDSHGNLQRDGSGKGQTQLPGVDNRHALIAAWARIFDKPRATFSPNRIKAADRAFAEFPDLAQLVVAIEGAKIWRERKPGSTEFTDIFGTFRGTGDLASRIAFFIKTAEDAKRPVDLTTILSSIPSDQHAMVRERLRHAIAWLRNSGDERNRQSGELAQAWFRTTFQREVALDAGSPIFLSIE